MKKYFVISTDTLTAAQEKALSGYLAKFSWWHWLPTLWLAIDSTGSASASAIRDEIHKLAPMARAWVLEVKPETWAALTKKDASGNSGSDWVERNWR